MKAHVLSLEAEWRPLLLIAATGMAATVLTMLAANLAGANFIPWFKDANDILLVEALYVLGLALIWDSALIAASSARRLLPASSAQATGLLASWKRLGFFSLGPLPLALVLLTSAIVIGTSNLTLISLERLHADPAWRDPLLWSIESPLFAWLSATHPDIRLWDRIYHGAWPIEMFAVFMLLLLGRNARQVVAFCFSFILLFYLGRFLGLLNPVMGPAFFRPEFFPHLAGSVSGAAMHLVAQVIADPDYARRSAVLLGGVSAMPSLHVGMVALTAYWLWKAERWTAWLTLPWLAMVWMATILLGWHYILDGVGGIALAWLCAFFSHSFLDGKHGDRMNAKKNSRLIF
jgi:membrane-associated phospholipid phosphatase